jgi:hypothetical protein
VTEGGFTKRPEGTQTIVGQNTVYSFNSDGNHGTDLGEYIGKDGKESYAFSGNYGARKGLYGFVDTSPKPIAFTAPYTLKEIINLRNTGPKTTTAYLSGRVFLEGIPEPSSLVLAGTAALTGFVVQVLRRRSRENGQRDSQLGRGAITPS